MKQYYLPIAIAVVSWAHKLIDDAILETGYDKFVYCDTDSIHTLGELPASWVDNKELGKFKLEAFEILSKYVRQKCYIVKDNNGWNITCCGMCESLKDWLVNRYGDDIVNIFKIGLTLDINTEGMTRNDVKLLPKQVPGGTILVPTRFSLL